MPTFPVPNFRLPTRLVSWMRENSVSERIPEREFVFFKANLPVSTRALTLVSYASQVRNGRLPAEMEAVILQHPAACLKYANFLRKSCIPAIPVPDEIVDACCQEDHLMIQLAATMQERIVRHEHKIVSPNDYVEYAGVVGRVPELEERILFSGDALGRAGAAFKLIERTVTGLGYGMNSDNHPILQDQRLRDLIKTEPDVVLSLMVFLGRRSKKLPAEFWEVFAGNGTSLWHLAEHLKTRLPEELERTWEGAKRELVQYAVKWVRGPLPEEMEVLLIGDTKAAADYAFQVVRGFSSPRLSPVLDNFMHLSDNDPEVKRYIAECDRVEEMKRLISEGIAAAG